MSSLIVGAKLCKQQETNMEWGVFPFDQLWAINQKIRHITNVEVIFCLVYLRYPENTPQDEKILLRHPSIAGHQSNLRLSSCNTSYLIYCSQ